MTNFINSDNQFTPKISPSEEDLSTYKKAQKDPDKYKFTDIFQAACNFLEYEFAVQNFKPGSMGQWKVFSEGSTLAWKLGSTKTVQGKPAESPHDKMLSSMVAATRALMFKSITPPKDPPKTLSPAEAAKDKRMREQLAAIEAAQIRAGDPKTIARAEMAVMRKAEAIEADAKEDEGKQKIEASITEAHDFAVRIIQDAIMAKEEADKSEQKRGGSPVSPSNETVVPPPDPFKAN